MIEPVTSSRESRARLPFFDHARARFDQFFTLLPEANVPPEIAQHFKRNFFANAGDMVAWLFGISFISVNAILPVFASRLTDSPLVIGMIPALLDAGWFLPQLFLAPLVERQPRKMPLVIALGAFERVPFLVLPFAALWLPTLPSTLAITLFLLLTAWRALGSGIVATPWQEMVAKVIPVTHRGRFFGLAHFAGQLLGVGGAALAALILARLPYPQNFALSFGVGAVSIWVSLFLLMLTREPALPPPIEAARTQLNREYARRLGAILKSNPNFRLYLLSRWLSFFGFMAGGFLAVYAVERFQLEDAAAGVFTSLLFGASVVGNTIWGAVGDRYGHKWVMVFSIGLWLSALGAAILSSAAWGFYAVFALLGLSNSAGIISDLNLAMEFGPEAERPTYIGLTRTVTGPALLVAPLMGGWLAQVFGYPALFITSFVFALSGGVVLALLVKEPRHLKQR